MRRLALYFAVLLAWASPVLRAQAPPEEGPRQLTGSLVFGWMETTGQEFFREHRSNPFTTLRMNFQSYFLDPTFLTYNVQGRLSSGFQEGFTGMSEGSGVAFDATFLPARPWPFRFYYSRSRRLSFFSGLSTSYARFTSRNDDSTLGFQWHYSVPKGPALDVSFSKVSATTTPETVLAQGFETRSRTLSLSGHDYRKGWFLNGSLSLQRLDTQYLLGSEQGSTLLTNRNNIKNLIFLAQRPIRRSLNFLFSANRTANNVEFDRGRFDQAFDSLLGKLEYKPGRFQGWSQVRLTRSTLESRASTLLGGPAFLLPSTRISNRMFDAEARYQLRPYLSFFGRSEYTQIVAPETAFTQRAGNFWNAVSGAQFLRSHKSLVLSSSYYLYTTLTRLQTDSPSRLLGHAFDASVSVGDPSRVRLSGLYALNRSREDARSLFFITSDSDRGQLAVARTIFRRWTLELRGGLARMRYERQDLRSDFLNRDYGVDLRGTRFYLGYFRTIGSGDSFQPLLGLGVIPPAGLGRPLSLVAGSSSANTTVHGFWNLTHSIILRGTWRGQVQTFGSLFSSRFEQQEATLEWHFRRIRFEAGYVVYRYNFGSPIFRKQIIFRVTRDFRLF